MQRKASFNTIFSVDESLQNSKPNLHILIFFIGVHAGVMPVFLVPATFHGVDEVEIPKWYIALLKSRTVSADNSVWSWDQPSV